MVGVFEARVNGSRSRVLYYNTHGGALANMAGVAKSLELQLDSFNPSQVTGYGMGNSRAQRLIRAGHPAFVCSRYDVVILGDTIPHGRAILTSLLEQDPTLRCNSRVIVEMTNRFNWDVKDKIAYYKLWRRLAVAAAPNGSLHNRLVFTANNNVEKAFVEHHINAKLHDVRILRPIGTSTDYPYPDDLDTPDILHFASRTHDTTRIFDIMRDEHNIPLIVFPFNHKYGGPNNLLLFKGFIDVPYQYSVMKFYENIAYGVPMFVPTPRFYDFLVKKKLHFTHNIDVGLVKQFPPFPDTPVIPICGFPEWSAYFDYYDPMFEPYVYFFDSFEELSSLRLVMRPEEVDYKHVRTRGPAFYERYRADILEGWARLFREMGFDGTVVAKQDESALASVSIQVTANHVVRTSVTMQSSTAFEATVATLSSAKTPASSKTESPDKMVRTR
ncbi:hypothetical protein BC830DRAFT_1137330 [Chytriomyces sp. MP71]|nr:hypothetical protein BC830DRAFT_1137330 [Chytriomyces sp. MP71]